VLDTTRKVRWSEDGPQLNPRSFAEMRGGPEATAPALNNAGQAAWVSTPVLRGKPQLEKQSLMTTEDGARQQSLPVAAAGWDSGRFSPDGQTLLVETAGPSDWVLAIEPGRPGSARQLLLTGDLPSDRVRTELVGWVGADEVLVAVHQADGAGTLEADADLAVLTLDLDARTADVAVVGRVDAGDTGSAFSYAHDLLAVDLPTNGSG
jgi:hypothetical protein